MKEILPLKRSILLVGPPNVGLDHLQNANLTEIKHKNKSTIYVGTQGFDYVVRPSLYS